VCVLDAQLGEDLLDALVALVDNSLVFKTVGPDDEPRFGMLETVREYGEERLAESDEVEPTRWAHALFYLALAERAAPELRGRGQAVWLERMEREHANVRAALAWLTERDDLHA